MYEPIEGLWRMLTVAQVDQAGCYAENREQR